MPDEECLRWPYGFRFEWVVKRVHKESSGPTDDSSEPNVKLSPSHPAMCDILRHIPDHVGDQLQSTLLSLSQFRETLTHLQISSETKRIVLQRVLGDMASNEREALLTASSWWRQQALEHGITFVDAITSHYLYLSLTTDLSSEWELSRKFSELAWETQEAESRRVALLTTAAEHVAHDGSTSNDMTTVAAYIARAETIRELIIYANKKICMTVDAQEEGQDLSIDCLIGTLLNKEDDNAAWKTMQLERCKRVASIVQLNRLCELNNWTLVACHVETDNISGRPKLFRRLLNVVSCMESDQTRSKALVRPAIQPYPMLALSEHKSSDRGRKNLTWQRCPPDLQVPARYYYPHNEEFKELESLFGRLGHAYFNRPASMSRDLERKVNLFDFFDEQDERIVNPFAHFRHTADEFVQLLITSGHTTFSRDQQSEKQTQGGIENHSHTAISGNAVSSAPETPRKLIVHSYQLTPLHTPLKILEMMGIENSDALSTPTKESGALDSDGKAKIELLRSDLAVLFHAFLTARDVEIRKGKEAITAALATSKSFTKITLNRLLANPTFEERYGVENDKALPREQENITDILRSLLDDTADLVQALLQIRGIDLAVAPSVAAAQLTSPLIPAEVAQRALINSRLESMCRKNRGTDDDAALAIKLEMEGGRLAGDETPTHGEQPRLQGFHRASNSSPNPEDDSSQQQSTPSKGAVSTPTSTPRKRARR